MAVTKPYQSPFKVTYDDLVADAEAHVRFRERFAARGGWQAKHSLEVAKKTLELLKKFKKDPQINLFDEFEKIKP